MMMKRILHCTLIFMVLVTAGCWPGSSEPQSNTTQNTSSKSSDSTPEKRKALDLVGAARDMREASDHLTARNRSETATVKPVKQQINQAIEKLGGDEKQLEERCADCSDEAKDKAKQVVQRLTEISSRLGRESQKIADIGDDTRQQFSTQLKQEADALTQLNELPKPTPTQTSSPTASVVVAETDTDDPWWWLAVKMLAVVVGLVLLAGALSYLWKRSWRTVESNVAHLLKAQLAAARETQPDYAPKLSSLSSAQAEMSSRLNDLDSEVRSLARLVRESLATRRSDHNPSYGALNHHSHIESVSPKDEPEFPVSAVDYLGKMNRFANVVRPDFQNGILVNDPEGDGELMLIRDSRDDNQPLFVVPRATQFQTKQDFYTYYQKYYDCVRPSAGDVWIIGPAVVEKVAGGWQLREKGMLEIR